MISFSMVVTVLGGLSLFLYGMKTMSEGLQKVAGNKLRKALKTLTNNRFSGVFTGFFITAAIQSSSATTVMLVSFVNAGLMNLTESLGVILGANIGTTVTGWLVAILGFKVKISLFALPAITLGFFSRFIGKQRLTDWGEVLLGFGILFFGLTLMKDALGDLKHSHEVVELMSTYRASSLLSTIMVIAAGSAVTMIIQSSSATMALTMTLASQNLIDYPTCAALVLGENIGTTITANIAAIGTSAVAKQAARAHLIFNVMGVVWVLIVFEGFLNFVDFVVPGSILTASPEQAGRMIPDHLAAFHTMFNIINTLLFLPLLKILARGARLLVRAPEQKEPTRLRYLYWGLINTPPLAIEESKRELARMADMVLGMLDSVMELFNKERKSPDDYEKYAKKIGDMEIVVDGLEREITEFLVSVIRNTTSKDLSEEISEILNAVSNLERIGDHCEILLKQIRRIEENELSFTENATRDINKIAKRVRDQLELINDNITQRKTAIMSAANNVEGEINAMRHEMKKGHIDRLNRGVCDVNQGLIFIDMLNSFEKIGDHAYNIAQSISGVR